MKMKVVREIIIEAKDIADLMVTVIETPVLPWISTIDLHKSNPAPIKGKGIDYSQVSIYNEHLEFQVVYDDPDDEEGTYNGEKIITWKDMQKGFELMSEKFPATFAAIVDESYDAADADLWFQFVVLGEDVYG